MKCSLVYLLMFLAVTACSGPKKEAAPKAEIKRTMDTTFVTAESTRVEKFRIFSPSMQRDIKVAVVLPPEYDANPEKKYPVLYTLHGYGAPWDTWANMPKLRKQLKGKPFIYTCLDGDIGSNYIDSHYPLKTDRKKGADADTTRKKSLFTTFFFKEFVPGTDGWYRTDPAKRGVTGFSMGGGGAMHYMLENPGLFCSVSGLSTGSFDLADPDSTSVAWMERMLGSYKEFPERYRELDTFGRLAAYKDNGTALPPVYQHCGTEDFLLEHNRKLSGFMKEKGLDITYKETAGGHNWKFWHPASVGIAEFHWKYFSK